MTRATAALEELARAYDIQISYRDLTKKEVFAPSESLLAALKGMGVIESAADVRDALKAHEASSWAWHVEPVVVAWGDGRAGTQRGEGAKAPAGPSVPGGDEGQDAGRTDAARVRVRVPANALDGAGNLRLELEDGRIMERPFTPARLKVTDEATVGGQRYVEVSVRLTAGLPFGYHRLCVEIGGRQMRSCLIAAPRKAYAAEHGPSWGVFLPLYALHSARSWGIGDYTDLGRLIEWAGAKGAGVVATLPLLPTFLDTPFEPSPYQPVSRLFWNEVYVDPEAPLDSDATPLVDARVAERARRLTQTAEVDYAAVMALKRQTLEAQASALKAGSPAQRTMEKYLGSRPDVGDYAAFRAAMEKLGPDWRAWPKRQREGRLRPDDYAAETARYFEYAQWRAHCQMHATAETAGSLGMRSYLDLPVGVHPQGYDPWRYREVFGQGLTVGAPPDLLATNGQNWGFQPLLPRALRESGYEYVVKYLRHYFASAKMLRIDHAIGLHRLYWIPDGGKGSDGVFVRQPAEELYAVLCLESLRNQAVVVAEDLGLVPPEVGRGLRAHGISGMYVQMFEMTGRKLRPIRRAPARSAASFGTHDLPPFAAYWKDQDLEQREAMGLLAPPRVAEEKSGRERNRRALVAYLKRRGLVGDESDIDQVFRGGTALLAESEAEWVMLNLEDTWGETRAQNLPGTTSEQHANWVSRAAHGLEAFESVEALSKAIETVRLYRRSDAQAGKRAKKT